MTVANLLIGLLMISTGTIGLKFHFKIANLFGRSNWFERKLGGGATYLVVNIVAIFLVIFGLLTIFGFADDFMSWITAPIRGLSS